MLRGVTFEPPEISMPFIRVTVADPALEPAQVRALQRGTTEQMASILGKKAELTNVVVEQIAAASWSIGGESTGLGAYIEAKITDGTNTPEEKARYIAAAMAMLRDVLGPGVPKASYVVLHDLAGEAWGYDGLTQAARRAARAVAA
jgi:4-oxalocrotonate tautomerase